MPAHATPTLIVEVGNAATKITLVDLVDGEYRLIARAEGPSTIAPPVGDLWAVVFQHLPTLETITGRELVRGGRLIIPGDEQGNGVGAVTLTTSAAGVLRVVVAALSAQQSAREALNAARSTYAVVEKVFALDQAGAADERWLAAQIGQLASARPDLVLITGGFEGGAISAIERVAHIVGLLAKRLEQPPHIVYAGNSAAAGAVRAALGDGVEPEVVENIRPSPHVTRLEPVRAVVRRLYEQRTLPALPGLEAPGGQRPQHIGTVVDHQGLMVRYLAERFGRNILALDVGAAHAAGHMHTGGRFSQAVLAQRGLSSGALALVEETGAEDVLRWLPYELSAGELTNRLLNRLLRPNVPPADDDELLLDHAIMREAVRATIAALAQTRDAVQFDLVIAGGAIARAARPGLALLTLLDALPLDQRESLFAVDVYLDTLSLLSAAGSLAYLDADAAACLVERDALNNGPLATVIAPQGNIRAGSRVLEAELRRADGGVARVEVLGGQIARIELPRGQRGTLRIRPASGITIGNNPAGAEVLSDEAAISGSALGIVVDARPRPLQLPEAPEERRSLILSWLQSLDAAGRAAERALEARSWPSPNGAGEPDASGNAAPEAGGAEAEPADDMRAMRASLVDETKPKRGFFRRS